MKIEHRKGDLFTTEIKVLAHGCNCQGFMGAGIAKAFRDRYPENYSNYRLICKEGLFPPGGCFVGYAGDGKTILNLATQEFTGPCAKLEYFREALETAIHDVPDITHIAMPQIGCGIGGLIWSDVESMLKSMGHDEITCVVYSL
jgi:O-acetyl-ADP-ribose deacetylase (regulator of RNase III)